MNVRLAQLSDASALAAIYAHYVLHTPATFEEVAPTPADFARRIDEVLAQYPFYVAEDASRVTGYAYASAHHVRASFRWAVNVGIYVAADRRRSGVGRALYRQLLPMLTRQGYARAYASITLPNDASVGLHESVGFRHVATFPAAGYKLGAWRDVGWWEQVLCSSLPPTPAEPIPFSQLR